MGFERSACVYVLAEAVHRNGFSFCTAEDLLFGNVNGDDIYLNAAMKFYGKKGTLYQNHEELIKTEREPVA